MRRISDDLVDFVNAKIVFVKYNFCVLFVPLKRVLNQSQIHKQKINSHILNEKYHYVSAYLYLFPELYDSIGECFLLHVSFKTCQELGVLLHNLDLLDELH